MVAEAETNFPLKEKVALQQKGFVFVGWCIRLNAAFIKEISWMGIQVRLVRGKWVKDRSGFWVHEPDLDGCNYTVVLSEKANFAQIVIAVREKLKADPLDDVEITYQWPHWMLGPEWRKANPVEILNNEDASLFMAIRADLEEIYLRAHVMRRAIAPMVTGVGLGPYMTELIRNLPHIKGGIEYVNSQSNTPAMERVSSPAHDKGPADQGTPKTTVDGIVWKPSNHPFTEGIITEGNPNEYESELSEFWRKYATGTAPLPTLTPAKAVNSSVLEPSPSGHVRPGTPRPGPKTATLNLTLAGAYNDVAPRSAVMSISSRVSSSSSTTHSLSTEYAPFGKLMMDPFDVARNERLARGMGTPQSRAVDMGSVTRRLFSENDKGKAIIDDSPMLVSEIVKSSQPPLVNTITERGSSSNNPVGGVAFSVEEVPCTQDAAEAIPTIPSTENVPKIGLAETRIVPAMHDRDAPPFFDDEEGEDELDRALRDVDYEGDDIFIGRIFKNKEECRLKLAIHAINRKFHFRYARSSPIMVIVVCVSDTCPWRVYAHKMEDSILYEIRRASLLHTCSVDARGNFHRQASTAVIGNMMRSRYSGGVPGPRAFELRRILRHECSLHISYWKAWKARELAMDNALGTASGSYALIPPYFDLLQKTNPGSHVALETEMDATGVERFKYCFFSLSACAKGYQYMRKVIVIDGTHLSGRYGGCLLAASAQDGNFQIFPIAFGVVNSENDASWEWFLHKLTTIVPDSHELVFVSDRHSSIYAAIKKVYPMSSHGACLVHLQRNIQCYFKSADLSYLVSKAGRAYRVSEFDWYFAQIQQVDPACADYLVNIGLMYWARSHFVGERYNIMTSNISESLNKVLTMVRDYPIISIFESIHTTLVTWFALRRDAAESTDAVLNPKIQDMIIANYEKSTSYGVQKIDDDIYEVKDEKDVSFAVHLWEQSCSCREFQLIGIPCRHAVAAAIREGVRADTLVGVHYTVEYRKLAYQGLIMPVPDIDYIAPSAGDLGGGKLAPPSVRRPPGRPKKKRFLSRGEFKVVLKRKCTRCKGRGHNRSTCKEPLKNP